MRNKLTYYNHEEDKIKSYGTNSADFNGIHLVHAAIHNSLNRNAGDTLLPQCVRRVFDVVGGDFGWHKYQVWEEFSEEKIAQINREITGIVVGGGGFMIRDQQGGNTSNSGWLWNISTEGLKSLKSKIVLFAIGYNRFRSQDDFDEAFARHVNVTVANSLFVGMRNQGSIDRLASYLDSDELKAKLQLQFCPTTCSWQLYPQFASMAQQFDAETGRQRILAFNFAYDRPHYRFGDQEDTILKSLARAIKQIELKGWQIVLTAHKVIDRAIETWLDGAGVNYVTHDLTEATSDQILAHYAQTDMVIGMRGHGQMIPFGLRRPIISLISHDKMGFFLDDIGHPDWGIEIKQKDLSDILFDKFNEFAITNRDTTMTQVANAQESVWLQTNKNVGWIINQLRKAQ